MGTLLGVAGLPDEELSWAGMKFVPYANPARRALNTLRLWKALGPLEAQAQAPNRIQVSRLSPEQQEMLYLWIRAMKISASFHDLSRAAITTSQSSEPAMYQLSLVLANGERHTSSLVLPRTLDEKQRKSLIDQRQADEAAEKVEVLN